MDEVFVLQHERQLDGCDEVKFIGVYRSARLADEAVLRLRLQPGFKDHRDGFTVDRYRLYEDSWAEGFVTD
jgi:homoserine kinase type II